MWNHKLYIYLWLWEATNWQSISVLICYKQFVCQSHFMTCLHLSFTLHDFCLFVLYISWLTFACPIFHSITYLCLPHPLHIISMTYLYLSFNTSWLTFACPFSLHDLPLALSSTSWLNGACVIHSMTFLHFKTYLFLSFRLHDLPLLVSPTPLYSAWPPGPHESASDSPDFHPAGKWCHSSTCWQTSQTVSHCYIIQNQVFNDFLTMAYLWNT